MTFELHALKTLDLTAKPEITNPLPAQNQTDGTSGAERKQSSASETSAMTKTGTLPEFQLTHDNAYFAANATSNNSESLWDRAKGLAHEAGAVGKDLVKGGVDEVKDHPDKVLSEVAKGLIYGAAGALVIAALPELAVVGAVAGAVIVGKEIYDHGGSVMHDAGVVADPSQHSQKEVADAHKHMQHVGAGAVDLAAGTAGAILGGGLLLMGDSGAAGAASASQEGRVGTIAADAPRVSPRPEMPTLRRPGGAVNPNDPIFTDKPRYYGVDGEGPAPVAKAPEVSELPRAKRPGGPVNPNDPIFTDKPRYYGVDGEGPAPLAKAPEVSQAPHAKRPGGGMHHEDPTLTGRAVYRPMTKTDV